MKWIGHVAVLAVLFSMPAFGQAPDKKPAPAPAMKAEKEPAKMAEARPARKSRAAEDARSCLQQTTNAEIIKCAEEYR
jgi:hypothetical protein